MNQISKEEHFTESDLQKPSKPVTVSELVRALKADVEEKHRHVAVVGEVSSFKQWRSGHCYFDIKDENALLPAVMFQPHFLRLPFSVANGMQILFSGRVSVYPANARLQMIVTNMEPLGQGALLLAFEQLKERLKSEGLFDPKYKKPIKAFNQCVGIITSSHGAVLRDMVRILTNRMPKVHIVFSPVRVQGEGAAREIAAAINLLDNVGGCDVLIVGRGGGSLEDLWAFNEEAVARAIFLAKTPILSAVGHETDTTISDFVADLRAATPTHAASIVVPDVRDVMLELNNYLQRFITLKRGILSKVNVALMKERQRLKDPRVLLFRHWQTLDDTLNRFHEYMRYGLTQRFRLLKNLLSHLKTFAPLRSLRKKREALFALKTALTKVHPNMALKSAKQNLMNFKDTLNGRTQKIAYEARDNFRQALIKLETLSPLKVLGRGFSVVQDEECHVVLSKIANFFVGQSIKIRLEKGVIAARVTSKEE